MAVKISGKLFFTFAVAFLLLLLNGIVSYRSVATLIANNKSVDHTQEVLDDLQELHKSLLQIETDARGFIVSGDQIFYDAYKSGKQRIPEQLRTLKDKTADNASHQQKFALLDEAIKLRLDLLDEYVRRREILEVNVIPSGQSGEGKRRMDAVKGLINEISSDERNLLIQRVAESDLNGRRTLITFVVANAVLLGLLCLVFYLAIRDIRERALTEARLRQARDELEDRVRERTSELASINTELQRSNRELQDFAFVASHDLQEPLRKIQAFGDRLLTVQGPKFDDQGRDYLARMQNAAERMHVLINDLLAYSRVTTKAQPFEPTDLNAIAAGVISDLENALERSKGTVTVDELPTIEADAVQMRQLFQNLIANALKFSKNGVAPIVNVHSELVETSLFESDAGKTTPAVRIVFSDNGIGFDEKYLDRIFTPFQRLHARNEYEGTGIGLAVCRKIVERHGGRLTAESTPGNGSSFIAVLPVKQSKEK